MQTGQRIFKNCRGCYGTGKQYQDSTGSIQSVQRAGDIAVDCTDCDGLGMKPWGWLRDEKETTMPGGEA